MGNINLLLITIYIFCTVVLVLFTTKDHRWKVLLFTSLLFYYLLIGYQILVLIGLSFIIYQFSFIIHKHSAKAGGLAALILIPLIISKSTSTGFHFDNYSSQNSSTLMPFSWMSMFHWIGLSYFTFNGVSYLMDIKRKYIQPERNFFFLLLYLVYFPAIFSGPLHRAKYLFGQFKNIAITNDSISQGLRLILWGSFKSLVLSQRLFHEMLTFQAQNITGLNYLFLGLIFFFYLYTNFSAFIDFFQGVSQIFNIKLKDNFRNRVYFSSSRQGFWKGWHITLNAWFRDYFFFLIAKHDRKRKYTDYILLITFLFTALWHEFSIAMLVWGTLNGLWIVLEKKVKFQKFPYPKTRSVLGIFYHLGFSAILALVFISPNPTFLIDKIFIASSTGSVLSILGFNTFVILISFLVMDYHYIRAKNKRMDLYLAEKPLWIRWGIYTKLILFILLFSLGTSLDNYYIQF